MIFRPIEFALLPTIAYNYLHPVNPVCSAVKAASGELQTEFTGFLSQLFQML